MNAAWIALFAIAAPTHAPDFVRDVQPILAAKCVRCHGATKPRGEVRLDTPALVRRQVVPGDSDKSLIVRAIRGGETPMPPAGEPPLTADEKATLIRWIAAGATIPVTATESPHWAFQVPTRPTVPAVAGVTHPVDAFLATAQARQGLAFAPPADRDTLLRRVTFDLTGLPPTREELRAFRADTAADAYEKVVERLLASPAYGERWARHWMDVWRYADGTGTGSMAYASNAYLWHWRDWIITSLRADKPYDQMVREMLAGDELDPDNLASVAGTGFLARNYFKHNRHAMLHDNVDHTATAFLGLTLRCARCHDHKYDPLTQEDYYAFRAFFEPHRIRTDAIANRPDAERGGLPRAYDAALFVPTHLFERGDERRPVGQPLAARPPKFLAPVPPRIDTIELPSEATHPFLRPELLAALIEQAERELHDATSAVETARALRDSTRQRLEQLTAVQPAVLRDVQAQAILAERKLAQELDARLPLLERQHTVAAARVPMQRARVAAEVARYRNPPDPRARDLARIADQTEAVEKVAVADQKLAQAGRDLTLARAARRPGDAASADAVSVAQRRYEAARVALTAINEEARKPDGKYTRLGQVYPASSSGRRLALARWIADANNPLTARVAVNQIWLRHFGSPLVPTVTDFGRHGSPPTHPELLDWLAVELHTHAWSMKHLHRLILTSRAYRQSSDAPAEVVQRDPNNQWLARMNVQRLEAEAVRDAVLAAAGTLDRTLGGAIAERTQDATSRRRSLYLRHSVNNLNPLLEAFDAAAPNECYRRTTSILPQQALALLNSDLVQQQAASLAQRLNALDDSAFLLAAWEQTLGRPPTQAEVRQCRAFLAEQTQQFPAPEARGRSRTSLLVVLFNHNDFVTLR